MSQHGNFIKGETMMNDEQRKELYGLLEDFGVAVDERNGHTPLVFNDAIVRGPSTNDLDMEAYNLFAFIEELLDDQAIAHEKALDEAYNEGERNGFQGGFAEGKDAGYEMGREDGFNEGYDAGVINAD